MANYLYQNRKKYGSRDRRFFHETVFAAFRHKAYLDYWVKHLALQEQRDEAVILMAAWVEQIAPVEEELTALLNRPDSTSILDALKKRQLPAGSVFDSPEEQLSIRYSVPLRFIRRWIHRFGAAEIEMLLKTIEERPPLCVRANPVKITRSRLLTLFEKQGFVIRATEHSALGIIFKERVHLFDTEAFRKGLFEIQDEGSQLVCEKIAPQPGDLIWDVCAGGGGKALALAGLMENKGRVVATDIRAKKLDEIKKRALRAEIHNIFPADLNRMDEIKQARQGFDKIVVDAPCSGTGTLRRNPDMKWKLREDGLATFQHDQVAIVENALPRLKPGGRLYYITCSMEPEENEQVIEKVLQKHPELHQEGEAFHLYPHHHGTDGFFMAILEKKK